ncbi:MAG: sugar transferase [Verrucomicrobiota bacterium]|nr:sugar transferase [Verrucomicrobiota bacterium]
MKSLIYCNANSTKWVKKYFPNISPYMLTIVNKPLLEYYIDLCTLLSIREVRIIQNEPKPAIENFLGDGSRWGLTIDYATAKPKDSEKFILKKNRAFLDNSDFIMISGMFFINYDKNKDNTELFSSERDFSSFHCNSGEIIFNRMSDSLDNVLKKNSNKEIHSNKDSFLRSITSLKDYYDISFDVLKNKSEQFVLPGYNNEKGIHIGQNVAIAKTADIKKPVSIGSDVQLKKLSSIGPNVILGNNTFVDQATTINSSIILDKTYIGSALEINNKIVSGNLLMDPETGESLKITDAFFLSNLTPDMFKNLSLRFFNFFLALFLICCMTLPFILFRILLLLIGGVKTYGYNYYLYRDSDSVSPLSHADRRDANFLQKLYMRFSLDKIPLLIKVLKGKLYLAGNSPMEQSVENYKTLQQMPLYHPAVFTYCELLGTTGEEKFERQLDELYYSYNSTLKLDIKIIIGSFFKKLIG